MTAFRTLVLAAVVAASLAAPVGATEAVTVFAAASLKNVIDDAGKAYMAKSGVEIKASYAASSALARQIEQGAPADIFASADLEWMDYLAARKLIRQETRVSLLGNVLVMIGPANADRLPLDRSAVLGALGAEGRLVTGDVNAVPAGKYAKTALQTLGLWNDVESRIAGVESVRAALTLVARGEAPLGIVYATDAALEPRVAVVATFPATSHPRIVYPFAQTSGGKPHSLAFLAYLRSDEAGQTFAKAGFTRLSTGDPSN